MRQAIRIAYQGISKGQTPFGACIVKGKRIVACAHNHVWDKTDITAHAEIMTLREACRKMNSVDLSDCIIYSTCEPCPMCFSAIHWARISKIFYGTSLKDAQHIGFNELPITNHAMKRKGKLSIKLQAGVLRKENLELFKTWAERKKRKAY